MSCQVLTLSSVKFYLDESIIFLRVMWNNLNTNICTDDIIQFEFIPPLIPIVFRINSSACQQAKLQHRPVT